MIVSKKSIGLIVLFLIPRFAIGKSSVDSIVAKQDSSMAIRTDSLCCNRSMCNCDTVQQDSCLQRHRLSFINKGQKMTRDHHPEARRKADPDAFGPGLYYEGDSRADAPLVRHREVLPPPDFRETRRAEHHRSPLPRHQLRPRLSRHPYGFNIFCYPNG